MAVRKLLVILGIPVDDLSLTEAVDRIEEFISIGNATGKTHQVASINPDLLLKASKDPEVTGILQNADMTFAEGEALLRGARQLGIEFADQLNFGELISAVIELASIQGYVVSFLGKSPGLAERAAEALKARYPNLKVSGAISPALGSIFELDPLVIEDIRMQQADLLIVGLDSPDQEKWIAMHLPALEIPVIIGAGDTLANLAGVADPSKRPQASLIDRANFELFLRKQIKALRSDAAPRSSELSTGTAVLQGLAVVHAEGRLDRANQAAFVAQAERALDTTPFVAVNLAKAEFLDSSAFGTLVALTKRAREAGGELWITNVRPPVQSALELLRLDRFLEIRDEVQTVFGERGGRIPMPPSYSRTAARSRMQSDDDELAYVYTTPRRFDAATAPEVLEKCTQALATSSNLILDLSYTAYVSSAGMAVMVQLSRQAKEAGGEVRVAGCSPDVKRSLKLARLDAILSLYPDVVSAQR